MTPHAQSVRAYLSELDKRGWLKRIAQPVDPRFEISAHLCLAGDGPALRFDRVVGTDLRVFGNLLASRERIALGLGVHEAQLQDTLLSAIARP